VLSIAIYDHVEALDYASAHLLSGLMLLFSFLVLLVTYLIDDRALFGE
jgi:molybdate transport system permease protein